MIRDIQKKLKLVLDHKRYEHSVGVMYTSAALAMAHGVDIDNAMLAGLLHDCAKCISKKESVELCDSYNIQLTSYERENPGLLHAKLGATLAKELYQLDDEDILNAIKYHTTGRPGMSDLEKIIYVSDYIEPHRSTPNIEGIRTVAFNNLDRAIEECSKRTISYLKSINTVIDPATEETYRYYENLYK